MTILNKYLNKDISFKLVMCCYKKNCQDEIPTSGGESQQLYCKKNVFFSIFHVALSRIQHLDV